MHTTLGTRRRLALSIGEVDQLRTAAVACVPLAALLQRHIALNEYAPGADQSCAHLKRARTALLQVAVTAAALTQAPNTQPDVDLPPRTWCDYAQRSDFRTMFRFAAADVPRLRRILGFDADEHAGRCRNNGYSFSADMAISVLLYTFATNATLQQLNEKFGLKRSKASAVLEWATRTVYERWHKPLLVTDFKRWAPQFPAWARATLERQGRAIGYSGIVGLVDGTFFSTCRPMTQLQSCFFSGHKWDHGVAFQGVLAPNGLIIDFAGPFEARHVDKWLLNVTKVCDRFGHCMSWAATQPWGGPAWPTQIYYLYGDSGYNRRPYLQTQFQRPHGGQLTPDQTACNYALSRTRVPNEWIYGRMAKLWPYIADEANLHVGTMRRVGNTSRVVVAAILTNAHTCCDGGNATSEYFGLTGSVPSLEEYFESAPPEAQCPPAWYDNWDEFPQT
jgi:hypothetical protein